MSGKTIISVVAQRHNTLLTVSDAAINARTGQSSTDRARMANLPSYAVPVALRIAYATCGDGLPP